MRNADTGPPPARDEQGRRARESADAPQFHVKRMPIEGKLLLLLALLVGVLWVISQTTPWL